MTDGHGPADPPGLAPGPNVAATRVWDRVVDDMATTAAELADEGWTVLELHPGDVAIPRGAERAGLDVVLPDPEFERLSGLVGDIGGFDEYRVYRAGGEGLELALVVALAHDETAAVLVPLYYQVDRLRTAVGDATSVPVFLRTLGGETVRLDLEEPDLLLSAPE